MLYIDSLSYAYPNQPSLFEGFSWHVNKGETWAVLGPSGCGKTTLLYLLAGLRQPDSGTISILGEQLLRPRPTTGLILQDYGLLPWATVRENASLGLKVRSFYGPDGTHAPLVQTDLRGVDVWLERLGIMNIAGKYPSQISGGQRQRTAIARTLTIEPDLLLMDEPFSSLDVMTRSDLQKLTLELCRENHITMIIVTHSIEEAIGLGEKILVLHQPPNRSPVIIENPDLASIAFRESHSANSLYTLLQQEMEKA